LLAFEVDDLGQAVDQGVAVGGVADADALALASGTSAIGVA